MTWLSVVSLWWAWLCAALVFGILEMLLPSYIFLGFALGAGVMGILLWSGALPVDASWSLVVFAALSLVAYVLLRWLFGNTGERVKIINRDINDN